MRWNDMLMLMTWSDAEQEYWSVRLTCAVCKLHTKRCCDSVEGPTLTRGNEGMTGAVLLLQAKQKCLKATSGHDLCCAAPTGSYPICVLRCTLQLKGDFHLRWKHTHEVRNSYFWVRKFWQKFRQVLDKATWGAHDVQITYCTFITTVCRPIQACHDGYRFDSASPFIINISVHHATACASKFRQQSF